ncbi:hypothetical protein C0989_007122, partial [Termitomyces sp. Mn162]
LSTAVAGPSGPPSGADVMQPPVGVVTSMRSKSGICLGVVQLVPEGSRVVQAEVTPEQFAEAVGQARGPPTLKWCQAAAPREWDLAWKDKDITIGTAAEQLSCLQELEVRTVHLQAWVEAAEVATQQAGGSGVQETQQGSSTGEVWAAVERAQRREEWLANEAALSR